MQHILSAHTDEGAWGAMTEEERTKGGAAFAAYVQDLASSGVLVGSFRPEPTAAAKTVRIADDGATEIQDGPFADIEQQVSGIYIIDVPSTDAALLWAERNPAARFGAVEVRPVSPPPRRS